MPFNRVRFFLFKSAASIHKGVVLCCLCPGKNEDVRREERIGGGGDFTAVSLWLSWDLNCDPADSDWVVWLCEYLKLIDGREQSLQPSWFRSAGILTPFYCNKLNCNKSYKLTFLSWTCTVSDSLARFGALESLVNEMADDTWDSKALNRHSAIHFLDDDYNDGDDDEEVRLKLSKTPLVCWCTKLSCTLNMKSTIDFSTKITTVANLFPSHRGGPSFEGPLLTPASWKQWRK